MPNNPYPTYKPECVLITGATGGFGEAFCERFAAIGAKIIVHGRSEAKVRALCEKLDVPTYPLIFDICDKQATLSALSKIPADFQDIDVLINNAGGALGLDKAHESDLDDWENMIEMNNTSLIRITRTLLPNMVTRKKGHIINIGSIAGNWPYPGGNVYNAVKAFVKMFSLSIRADLQGTNVRVTNIEPGIAETPFSMARFKGDEEKAAAVYANTKPLNADDIAESVFWAATLPEHVNVNTMEVMPTQQSFGPLIVERNE
ncbi:MAG: NAD(P)-dependent oxidoreductase [Micavibrio sp.]|nr:NAD(P)-dependent oxidoreductase [Micavibrio sp.]|tara:strand:+ start:496 stop:1275 length:780 start_codon:yes stop_codon:yes gene_type:complete